MVSSVVNIKDHSFTGRMRLSEGGSILQTRVRAPDINSALQKFAVFADVKDAMTLPFFEMKEYKDGNVVYTCSTNAVAGAATDTVVVPPPLPPELVVEGDDYRDPYLYTVEKG